MHGCQLFDVLLHRFYNCVLRLTLLHLLLQGKEFIADHKEAQSATLGANVATVNEELQGIIASLHTGALLLLLLLLLLVVLCIRQTNYDKLHLTLPF